MVHTPEKRYKKQAELKITPGSISFDIVFFQILIISFSFISFAKRLSMLNGLVGVRFQGFISVSRQGALLINMKTFAKFTFFSANCVLSKTTQTFQINLRFSQKLSLHFLI